MRQLVVETQGFVVGDGEVLTHVAAGLLAQVEGSVLALPVLAVARQIRAAVEEVEVHAQFDLALVARAIVLVVAVVVAAGNEVETGHEGRAAAFQLVLRGFEVLDAGAQGRVVREALAQGDLGGAGRTFGELRRREHDLGRLLADDARIACRNVVQVGIGRGQVNVGKRQTARRLLDVDPLADARIGALLELLIRGLVLDVVFLGEIDLIAVTHHIEVGATGLEGDVLGGVEQFEIAHQLGFAEALDLAGGRKAVEQHLAQAELRLVAAVRRIEPNAILFLLLLAGPGRQVEARQEAAARHAHFFARLAEGVPARLDVRAFEHRRLGGFFQRKVRRRFGIGRSGRRLSQRRAGQRAKGHDQGIKSDTMSLGHWSLRVYAMALRHFNGPIILGQASSLCVVSHAFR